MGRATRDARLETRAARDKLPMAHEPYWKQIGEGLFLGYRKGDRGGKWIVRRYVEGKYRKEVLDGIPDDHRDANGVDVLSYFQAQDKARGHAEEAAKRGALVHPDLTVGDVLDEYGRWFRSHRRSWDRTEYAIDAKIRPELGAVRVADLTTTRIRRWLEALADGPPADPQVIRRRKATANRIYTILRAALNHCWRAGLIASDDAWRRVQPYQRVDQPKVRYLTPEECKRLLAACQPDFRVLVQGALITGARYGELIRLRCDDFNPDAGTVRVGESKTGVVRYVPLTKEGVTLFSALTADRKPDALIFLHADGRPWDRSHQSRPMREACIEATINPPAGFHILRHTTGSLLAMARVPLSVVAEVLGHADLRMTKRHYAHLSAGFVAEQVRANLPTFEGDPSPVVAIEAARA